MNPRPFRLAWLVVAAASALAAMPLQASLVEVTTLGISPSTGTNIGTVTGSNLAAGPASPNNTAPLSLDATGAFAQQNVLGLVTLSTPLVTTGGVPLQAGRPYLMTVNGNFDLTLWNFVVTVGALQSSLPLQLAQGNISNLFAVPNNSNVVPLPAAGWLFLGGLATMGAALRRRPRPRPSDGDAGADTCVPRTAAT